MYYKELTKSEIDSNHWTVLLKNNNSVLALKGNTRPLCDECPNNKKTSRKRRFVILLACDDSCQNITKKSNYSYFKCVNSVNGCNEGNTTMVVGLQIA